MWFAVIMLVPDAQADLLVATNAADEKAVNAVHRVANALRGSLQK